MLSCAEKNSVEPKIAEEGFFSINGSQLYYKTIGEGEPLVFIHGGPVLDHSYLLPQMAELAKHYKLIFYDQRACGKSSLEVDSATMNIAGLVNDIEVLKDSLKLDKINVLGHSWGGLLAMHYAINYPESLNSLILSNSISPTSKEWGEEQQILAERTTSEDSMMRVEIISSSEMKEKPSSAIEKLMLLSFKSQFYNRDMLDSLTMTLPKDFIARSRVFQLVSPDLESFDLTLDLVKLKIPTLIIYGDYEPAATISGRYLETTIPNAEYVVVDNCGHFPFIEQKNKYFEIINQFLKKL